MAKILLIEDEKNLRDNIQKLLLESGYEVDSFDNGIDTIQYLNSNIPDLVLSDIMMDDVDGYQLLRVFRSKYGSYSIPFIFLTAKADYNDLRKGMEEGADDYLFKPFKVATLLNSVKTQLEKSKTQRQHFQEIANNIAKYVPHELRTPLVPVMGYLNFINSEFSSLDEEELKTMLNRVDLSVKRLHKTIEKFMHFVDLETVLSDPDKKTNYLNTLQVMEIGTLIKLSIAELAQIHPVLKDAEVNIQNYNYKINDFYFRIVINELLTNAIKFLKVNGQISITGKFEDEHYSIEIINDAISRFEETNPDLIQPFVQFNRTEHQKSGNGLGISIIKCFAKLNNFSLVLNNLEGGKVSVKLIF